MATFRRINQVAQYLKPAPETPIPPAGNFEGIPAIRQRGGDSRGPSVHLRVCVAMN